MLRVARLIGAGHFRDMKSAPSSLTTLASSSHALIGVLLSVLGGGACLPATNMDQWPETTAGDGVVVLIHGAGEGEDTSVWADAMAAEISDVIVEVDDGSRWHVLAWDWYERSRSRELASGAAADEGAAIGERAAADGVSHIHFIGHSTGAIVVQSALQAIANNDAGLVSHATLLDPFALLADTDCSAATFCDVWFNDDDGAPGSDAPITSAFNTNITFTRPDDQNDRGHWWPTLAYGDSVRRRSVPGFGFAAEAGGEIVDLHRSFPRGGGY